MDEWADLKKKTETLKKNDPKNINKNGVVEVDEFIDLVISQYHRLEILAAEKVYQLFLAADFNGNLFISYDEFNSVFRNVVNNNLGKEYGYLVF